MLLHKAKHTRDGVDKLYVKRKGVCEPASIDDCNQRRQRVTQNRGKKGYEEKQILHYNKQKI